MTKNHIIYNIRAKTNYYKSKQRFCKTVLENSVQ